jgi:glycosyltransferase involved in cell wall biosynthesis
MKRKTSVICFRARISPTRLTSMRLESADTNLAQMTQVILSTCAKKWVARFSKSSMVGSAVFWWTFAYRHAAAIIAGSSHTYKEFAGYREKVFFVPGENGINPSVYPNALRSSHGSDKLELIFVGGLGSIKAVDLALRGAAPLLQVGRARFSIVGDGPERANLEQLTRSLGVEKFVSVCGWVRHSEVIERLGAADVLVFPSIREFGGAAVFEALAMGAVPLVADFGGPGDIVNPEIGFKVSLTNENDVVLQIENVLAKLARDPDLLKQLRQQGMRYAREHLTWGRKAQIMTEVLYWTVGQGPRPDPSPPKARPSLQGREKTSNAPFLASC